MKSKPVDVIKGIGPVYKQKLNDIGIINTNDLIKRALKSEDRRKLLTVTDLSLGDLRKWAGYATLMMVNGIGEKNAALLFRAGVKNVGQLASQNTFYLSQTLGNVVPEEGEIKRTIKEEIIQVWVEESKKIQKELFPNLSDFDSFDFNFSQKIRSQVTDLLNFGSPNQLTKIGNYIQEKSIAQAFKLKKYADTFDSDLLKIEIEKTIKFNILGTYILTVGKITDLIASVQFVNDSSTEIESIPEVDNFDLTEQDKENVSGALLKLFNGELYKIDNSLQEIINNLHNLLIQKNTGELEEFSIKTFLELYQRFETDVIRLFSIWQITNNQKYKNDFNSLISVSSVNILDKYCFVSGLCLYLFIISTKNSKLYSGLLDTAMSVAEKFNSENLISEKITFNIFDAPSDIKNHGLATGKITTEYQKEPGKSSFTLSNNISDIKFQSDFELKNIHTYNNCNAVIYLGLTDSMDTEIVQINKNENLKNNWLNAVLDGKFKHSCLSDIPFCTDQIFSNPESITDLITLNL